MVATRPPRTFAYGLAMVVGLAALLAGYVLGVAVTKRTPKQLVRVTQLTSLPEDADAPAIAPDGKSIAFVSAHQIWIQTIGSGAAAPITNDDSDHEAPRWAGPNSIIYFAHDAIWDGSKRLVSAAAPGDASRDGKRLAFFQIENGETKLFTANRDGSNVLMVAKVPSGAYTNLRWSPDGRQLAFLRDGIQVMVVEASGGEPHSVFGGKKLRGFGWTPDGTNLVVSMLGDGPTYQLWAIPHDNSSPRQLTFDESSYESPDIDAMGDIVVSRRLPNSNESDIVLLSGFRW